MRPTLTRNLHEIHIYNKLHKKLQWVFEDVDSCEVLNLNITLNLEVNQIHNNIWIDGMVDKNSANGDG